MYQKQWHEPLPKYLMYISEKQKEVDPEEVNISVKATLDMFAVCVCSEEKVLTNVEIKGKQARKRFGLFIL